MNEPLTSSEPHRVFGVFRAPETAAIWMILVLLVFFGAWSFIERKNARHQNQQPKVELVWIKQEAGAFQVKFSSETSRYLAIYCCEIGGKPEMLFPRLGKPMGLDWPISANSVALIPGTSKFLRLPSSKPQRVFVLSHKDAAPSLPAALWKGESKEAAGKIKDTFYASFPVNGAEKL